MAVDTDSLSWLLRLAYQHGLPITTINPRFSGTELDFAFPEFLHPAGNHLPSNQSFCPPIGQYAWLKSSFLPKTKRHPPFAPGALPSYWPTGLRAARLAVG